MVTNKQSYLWERKKSRPADARLVTFSPVLLTKSLVPHVRSPQGSALPPDMAENFHCTLDSLYGDQHPNPEPRFFLLLSVLPHSPSPLGCFLRTRRQDRVIAQFTANTCLSVLPQPLIQMFSLPPLLTLALWSLSPELTFIIQLEITPSSRYQLPWEP